ncbi:MAG: 4Fe-4S dicluster domain-containing protein [Promethearchaeota archaeon]|jgi:heterodisulfide reductase subunit C
MVSKLKQVFLLSIYYLSPVIASIIYWFEEPELIDDMLMNLSHRAGNIFGVFSFIWMCFNIIMMLRLKLVEKNFELAGLVKFHTIMSAVALVFVFAHYPLLRFAETAWAQTQRIQITTGNIGMLMFLFLMFIAFIFMTNRLKKYKKFGKLRNSAFKKKITYNTNKVLHNLSIVAVFASLIHALISDTSKSSLLMRGVYIFFFGITIMGWIYHKLIRRFRSDSDPFVYRKASWDISIEDITEKNTLLTMKLLEKNPSLYPCFQCGVCTESCPVARVSEGQYNPRRLILNVLLGFEKKIFGPENVFTIWGCTLCDTCDEICPQKVEPTEIFSTLKNLSAERGEAPPYYYTQVATVLEYGKAIPPQPAIERRREELKLPPIQKPDINEIQKLLRSTNLPSKSSTLENIFANS